MKKIICIIIFSLGITVLVTAQDTTQKQKIYRTWVSFTNLPLKVNGVLYEAQDSAILVSTCRSHEDFMAGKFDIVDLHINTIAQIKVRRKNRIGRGALIGAVSGFVTGAIIGLAAGDDPPCAPGTWICIRFTAGQKALQAGTGMAILGGGLGALVGAIKIKIPIGGSVDVYKNNKSRLEGYSIKRF